MRMIHSVFQLGIGALTVWLVATGAIATATEPTPEGKSESSPVPRSKDPEVKAKESDAKLKESDTKAVEQKPKEADLKPKESDSKGKETEGKPKDPEVKAKEPAVKPKESEHKPKDTEKPKEADQKSKDADTKAKESEAPADNPCPAVAHQVEPKTTTTEPPATVADSASGERPKTAEPEAKKQPIRSSMVTAKLALMADPRLFPYEIEVDAKDKDLVLLGKVSQETDKKAATDIVRCLEGVHAVENRLKVESDATHSLVSERDKMLTQFVKERFEKSKTLQSVKFDVKTEDGVVTLSGSTRFQIIVLEAAQAARQIPGVRAVNTDAVRLIAGD